MQSARPNAVLPTRTTRRPSETQRRMAQPIRASTPHHTLHRCACGGGCPRCQQESRMAQSKLPISQPGDSSEREADHIAEQIIRAEQSHSRADAEINTERLQLARLSDPSAPAALTAAPPAVHDTLRSQGESLRPETRASLEPHFGIRLANVRVHTNAEATKSADSVNAHAYTVGNHVVFGSGQYAPHTPSGRRLLAHELTHVVQQSRSGTSALQRDAKKDGDCDPDNLEHLGTKFHKPTNEVQPFSKALGLKLQETHLGNPVAGEKDFVLFCPHRSSVPLNPLVPCTTVFKILNGNRPEAGKVGAWAQQPGKSELFWGFVKESLLSVSGPAECGQPSPTAVVGPRSPPDPEPIPAPERDLEALASPDRYGHKNSCSQDFLESHIWPAERLARRMLHHALACFCAAMYGKGKRSGKSASQFEFAFGQDWKTKADTIYTTLLLLLDAFEQGPYMIDCVTGCNTEGEGWPFPSKTSQFGKTDTSQRLWNPSGRGGTIMLCYENLEDKTLEYTAHIMIHEMGHLRLGLEDPTGDDTMKLPAGTNVAEPYGAVADDLWLRVPRFSDPDAENCFDDTSDEMDGIDPELKRNPEKWK